SMVEDYRIARQINGAAAEVNNVNIQRERFIEELETLVLLYELVCCRVLKFQCCMVVCLIGSPVSAIAGVVIVTSLVVHTPLCVMFLKYVEQ
nr:hypothetical protein [Tanacetum cinerariifolium]